MKKIDIFIFKVTWKYVNGPFKICFTIWYCCITCYSIVCDYYCFYQMLIIIFIFIIKLFLNYICIIYSSMRNYKKSFFSSYLTFFVIMIQWEPEKTGIKVMCHQCLFQKCRLKVLYFTKNKNKKIRKIKYFLVLTPRQDSSRAVWLEMGTHYLK